MSVASFYRKQECEMNNQNTATRWSSNVGIRWLMAGSFLATAAIAVACGSDAKPPILVASGDDGSGHTAPTPQTVAANAAVFNELPFEDESDFVLARRGLIAQRKDPVISDAAGNVVWNLTDYEFETGDSPDSVNPSLWRQAQLNSIHGLFKVSDRIYQVRGYDLANMTLIEGDTGWIIIDVMTAKETAAAAMELVREHLGDKPVMAVIYTHSHIDHFGGIRGVVSDDDLARGIPIIAPEGFLAEAVSENVLAGTAMTRRASYMFGFLLDRNPRAHVDSGLGKGTAPGSYGLVPPTEIVSGVERTMTLDGLETVFQNTPGAEAPAEMMVYFPTLKAMSGAENVSHVLHNVLTLRGAKVRDALRWSGYLEDAIARAASMEVLVASHHWPTWGNDEIVSYLKKQRDVYKFIHDQSLRLANQGLTGREIAEEIKLPESLSRTFAVRGYYGTLSHNSKAVYQHYFGWFDGNPANLNPLPPEQAAVRYVDAMGGSAAVVAKGREAYDRGEYRWTATLLNHVVFAEPQNNDARSLLADTYDQLGYQSESGPWRDFYLTGANELRGIERTLNTETLTPIDIVASMPTALFFDAIAVRMNGVKAEGKDTVLNFVFSDIDETHVIELENAVLHHAQKPARSDADATVTMSRDTWNLLIANKTSLTDAIFDGTISVDGNPLGLVQFFALLDVNDPTFGIVLP
jgi:alkyl sulfatase BDS1-like metallo-beta-lactamase superfamily hydrolase